MIEEVLNLVMALATVAITLLDPMLQLANGVDLYMEAVDSSPLIVNCPPRVENGSWTCSDRRPLPECYLYCLNGLVPAAKDQVDCETFRQDNTTTFSCVPAGVVMIGGLDENGDAVTEVEVFTPNRSFQNQLAPAGMKLPTSKMAELPESKALVSATTEWYNGQLVSCGGIYQKSCSFLEDFSDQFEDHSVAENFHEGASSTVLGPSLQLWGGIGANTRRTEVYTDQQGWTTGKRLSQDVYQSCATRINATHVAIIGGDQDQGWLSLVTSNGEVAKVNITGAWGRR